MHRHVIARSFSKHQAIFPSQRDTQAQFYKRKYINNEEYESESD